MGIAQVTIRQLGRRGILSPCEYYNLYSFNRLIFSIGNYERGDFDTPQDPMTNATIHAGLEGLYTLSSPMLESKFARKKLTVQMSTSL